MADEMSVVPYTGGEEWNSANEQIEKLYRNMQRFYDFLYQQKTVSFMDGFIKGHAEATRAAQAAKLAEEQLNQATQDAAKSQEELNENMEQGTKQASRFSRVIDSMEDFIPGLPNTIASAGLGAGLQALNSNNSSESVPSEAVNSETGTADAAAEAKKSFLSSAVDSLKSVDIGGIFSQIQSLGEKMISGAATEADKQKWEDIGNKINSSLAKAGEGAMQSLRPVMDMLITALDTGQFDTLLGALGGTFLFIAEAIGWVVTGLLNLNSFVQQHWDLLAPILAAIAGVYLVAVIIQLYAMAAAWLAANWPILLMVAAIALVIMILQKLGVSGATIIGVIGGAFFALGAVIMNLVAKVWNTFASLAEFLVNLFIDPVYAVKKLLYDFVQDFLASIYTVFRGIEDFLGVFMVSVNKGINVVLEAINKALPAINKIFGTNFESIKLLDENNVHAVSDKIQDIINSQEKPTSDKGTIGIDRMSYRNPTEAGMRGFNLASNGFNKSLDYMKGFSTDGMNGKTVKAEKAISATNLPTTSPLGANTIPNVGHVGSVGKVENQVDVSSEDLKMMRELAEMNAIQNFVSLTPTVQVTTGDINSGADLNSIITGISTMLQEEFVSTAEGVYT
ncbi:hypothetical protein ACE3NQ_00725 [Paenibacillus terreus]|uniref:Tail length tape measure protein n=1 Tax=Paenibacillus terreus TaxID=1387834 RepID=A0ABV5B172_9BACL